jgi:hypothetical protein
VDRRPKQNRANDVFLLIFVLEAFINEGMSFFHG